MPFDQWLHRSQAPPSLPESVQHERPSAPAMPAGQADDGLAVGVRLVGRRWLDDSLLAAEQTAVSIIGGFRAPPEPVPIDSN